MPEPCEIGTIWQLLFTHEEEEKIIALLNRKRLPPDKNGLKILILGKINSNSEVNLSEPMQDLIEKGLIIAGRMIKKKAGF